MYYVSFFQERLRGLRRRAIKHVRHYITKSVPAQNMQNDIAMLVNSASDTSAKREMEMFSKLLNRFITEAPSQILDWKNVSSPSMDQVVLYKNLSPPQMNETSLLKKLAVLKVNGGLGTSMALKGAKSALELRDGLTFLDFAIQQIATLNRKYDVDIPLLCMNSFSTHEDTLRITEKYNGKQVHIQSFIQSRYPRIMRDSLLPCPQLDGQDERASWYPPGHGDLYNALLRSGELDRLLKKGKRYLFVSNCDNLGAVVDIGIFNHMVEVKADFLMEVTDKTKVELQSGTLIDYEGKLRLLELAQVPPGHVEDFSSVRPFQAFNTNNLWIDLKALKKIMHHKDGMELEIIENPKLTADGRSVLQLETAAGAAIRHFKNARGINVPRSRFLPVQSCSDLLLLQSDIYTIKDGQPVVSVNRDFKTMPNVKLGDYFQKIEDFQSRIKDVPSLIDLDHLTVSGDVRFGRNVILRGTVIIIATEGEQLKVPDGCVLEDRLLCGTLDMTDI